MSSINCTTSSSDILINLCSRSVDLIVRERTYSIGGVSPLTYGRCNHSEMTFKSEISFDRFLYEYGIFHEQFSSIAGKRKWTFSLVWTEGSSSVDAIKVKVSFCWGSRRFTQKVNCGEHSSKSSSIPRRHDTNSIGLANNSPEPKVQSPIDAFKWNLRDVIKFPENCLSNGKSRIICGQNWRM